MAQTGPTDAVVVVVHRLLAMELEIVVVGHAPILPTTSDNEASVYPQPRLRFLTSVTEVDQCRRKRDGGFVDTGQLRQHWASFPTRDEHSCSARAEGPG